LRKADKSIYSLFIFISAIVLLMNISSIVFSPILTFINVSISAVLILIVSIFIKNRKSYFGNISADGIEFANNNISSIINGIPVPIAVLKGEKLDNVIFYNSEFLKVFVDGSYDFTLSSLVDPKALQNVYETGSFGVGSNHNFLNFSYGEKKFKIYANRVNDFLVLYFVDNTEYKLIKRKYLDSRICVGFIF